MDKEDVAHIYNGILLILKSLIAINTPLLIFLRSFIDGFNLKKKPV